MPAGKRVILVVEDEPSIRRVLSLSLWNYGLTVLEATTGQSAVELYQTHAADIGAVLLDYNLPDTNGEAVLERLRSVAPAVRCFFITGDADANFLAALGALRPAGIFAKPFNFQDLAEALRDAAHAG